MAKGEKTSGRIASKASGILRSSSASKTAKSVAGSALAQAGTSKSTSAKVARTTAKALDSGRTGKTTKSVAGSVLTQKPSTSTAQARNAAKTLASPYTTSAAKQVAASVLSGKKQPFPVKTYKVAGSSLTQKASASAVRKVAKKMAK